MRPSRAAGAEKLTVVSPVEPEVGLTVSQEGIPEMVQLEVAFTVMVLAPPARGTET